MSKSSMDSAYRIAHELLRDRMRDKAPEILAELEDIREADVLVVPGEYDHIEDVLRNAGTPFTWIFPPDLERAQLRSDQIVFVNCPGRIPPGAIRQLAAFVQDGGFLFTTDWALKYVLEPAFDGFVEHNDRKTADQVVRVEMLKTDDPFLSSMIGPEDDPQWWLEASSFPIRILDPEKVTVLVTSKEIGERYGESPVFVTFDAGAGRVYHMISHFYLQRSETRTARHRTPSSAYLQEKGITADQMAKYMGLGAAGVDTAALESAYTSTTITAGILLQKKLHQRARTTRSSDDTKPSKSGI